MEHIAAVVFVCCGCSLTDEHRKAIKYLKKADVRIEVVDLHISQAGDLTRFLDTRNRHEEVYIASQFGLAASVLDAAEKGRIRFL